jgi:biotin carboxylase
MRLQILGGGNNQVNAIKKARDMGHEVILIDYLDHPPGADFAHIHEKVSTFDWAQNLSIAQKYRVDGIMTTGTDQPVYTVAKVARMLGLPAFLGVETAINVTNKRRMKDLLLQHAIPTVPYIYVSPASFPHQAAKIPFPAVLKPLDSQGQRGVFRVEDEAQAQENVAETLSYSREQDALLESFYPSDEVTISAWVQNNETTVLTMTDRKTFTRGKHIGICYAHDYPSKHQEAYYDEAVYWTEVIQKAFGIHQGPLYIQMLIGNDGLVINEVACRIGGAYEEVFIPWVTGFDVLERVIQYSLTGEIGSPPILQPKVCAVTAQLFFAIPGKVASVTDLGVVRNLPGILDAGYNFQQGDTIGLIENATARAGYMVLEASDMQTLDQRVDLAYKTMGLWNEEKENLIIHRNRQRGEEK